MGLISLLVRDPVAFLFLVIPLLYSIIVHEVAHGWVADKMGDPTARLMGRLSFNPRSHLDPVGTLMLLVVGFGWAKPVPVNFNQVRNYRKGLICIAAAGPLANIAVAFLALLILRKGGFSPWGVMPTILNTVAYINIVLASFNFIPIPPLDGSKILMGFASPNLRYQISKLEPYGMFIVIGALFLGVIDPLVRFFREIIILFINLLL